MCFGEVVFPKHSAQFLYKHVTVYWDMSARPGLGDFCL